MATSNRPRVLYPTYINLYKQCPERYYHERVERQKPEEGFNAALTEGIAMHDILAAAASIYRRSFDDGAVVLCDIESRAESALPFGAYSSELAWRADVEAIVFGVKEGLKYLDGEARVLAAEATYQFPYTRQKDCPSFVLAAKVDLVLLKRDADDRPFLDVVDYKGGSSLRVDPVQEIAARIVVKQNASRFKSEYEYIQSTTIHLGAGVRSSVVVDDDECGRRWAQIKDLVSAISEADQWDPTRLPCASGVHSLLMGVP